MTDKEIIKGLECCLDEALEKCNECPYSVDAFMCKRMELLEDSLDLINRQQEQLESTIAGQETLQKALAEETKRREVQAERLREEREQKYEQIDLICRLRNEIAEKDRKIDDLKVENQSLRTAANCYKIHYNEARTEAIREFAERLKQRCSANSDINYYILKKLVDNLVKEMVGDAE